MLPIANGELRGVHAHGDATGARRDVIPRQRALAPLIQPAPRRKRQWMRRNDVPGTQVRAQCVRVQ